MGGRQGERGKAGLVWSCAEEGCGICWEKDAEHGATGGEKERETKTEIYGYGEGRYASGWGDGG